MADPIQMARNLFLRMLGGSLDTKRATAWEEYGYPNEIAPGDFVRAYRRHGIAFGAVSRVHSKCWGSDPWVIEGEKQDETRPETAWEREVKRALPDDFWHTIAEADRRRLIGRYSAVIILLKDGKMLHEPVVGAKHALEDLIPVWQNALTITTTDERTGKPTQYQYTDVNKKTYPVHPDRVVIFGDMSSDAVGFLEPGYNNVINLEKIEGGSGESFLKNSSRQIHVNFDKDVSIAQLKAVMGDDVQAKTNEVAEGLAKGLDKVLTTQGATAQPLVANVPDPKPHYEINVQTAAAAWNIPTKILIGNQTGERASTEDEKNWAATCQERRTRQLSREIHAVIRRLQRLKVIPDMGVFTVMWDDLTVSTLSERLANGKIMAEINASAIQTGAAIYEDDEIRSVTGFEAKKDAASNDSTSV